MNSGPTDPTTSGPTAPTSEPVIAVRGLVKEFGQFRALDQLDLTVAPGSIHGFLGPNGAGKSTTIRHILGLYRPTAGTVRVLGQDPLTHPHVLREVAYVPADVTLWPQLTGQETLDALANLRGQQYRDRARETELAEAFRLNLNRRVRTYSTGNRQKVLLVAALSARTRVLVMDEPTAGLDPLMEQVFNEQVRAATADGSSVLLSSHILSEVENLCDRVTIIRDGQVVEDGELAALRHLSAYRIRARFDAPVPDAVTRVLAEAGATVAATAADTTAADPSADAAALPGAVDVHVDRQRVPQVLAAVAAATPAEVTCSPASLEELFLRHYQVDAR